MNKDYYTAFETTAVIQLSVGTNSHNVTVSILIMVMILMTKDNVFIHIFHTACNIM